MAQVYPSQVVTVIHTLFPFTENQKETQRVPLGQEYQDRLTAILDLVDQIPSELINLSGEDYADFSISRSIIRSKVNTWRTRGVGPLEYMPSYRTQELNPLTVLRKCLERCPDEFPSTSTSELSFIQDDKFANELNLDINRVNQALSNAEWKATNVLAGSVMEALLLWALRRESPVDIRKATTSLRLRDDPKKLNAWSLHRLIKVTEELKVIRSETATQAILTKDLRNLIHPGRGERLGQKCDRGTAMAAVAGLEFVVHDLRKRYSQT
jgi:hypothetical protein